MPLISEGEGKGQVGAHNTKMKRVISFKLGMTLRISIRIESVHVCKEHERNTILQLL